MREEMYRATQVNTPGKFEMVERAVTAPLPCGGLNTYNRSDTFVDEEKL